MRKRVSLQGSRLWGRKRRQKGEINLVSAHFRIDRPLCSMPCVRKPVWSRPCCPLASCCPYSSARFGNWIREELFFCVSCREGSQPITGVNTYTHTYKNVTTTYTHTAWTERGSDSNLSEPVPRICLSKVVHQRMTLALLLRSFKTLHTTQQRSTHSHRGVHKQTHTHIHAAHSARTHHCCFHYTEGETNRALPVL